MFDWLRKLWQPKCPIPEKERQWLESKLVWLTEEFGMDQLLKSPILRPYQDRFSGDYDGSDEAIHRLWDEVCRGMGVDSLDIDLELYEGEKRNYLDAEFGGSGLNGEYRAGVFDTVRIDVVHRTEWLPIAATMAHELAHVRLLGERRVSHEDRDHEHLTDLTAIFFGFGLFLTNRAERHFYWINDDDSYGSLKETSGYLSLPTQCYALALIAWRRGETDAPWFADLHPEPKEWFEAALSYLVKTGNSTFAQRGESVLSGFEVADRKALEKQLKQLVKAGRYDEAARIRKIIQRTSPDGDL